MLKLKTVSGRLRELFRGREQNNHNAERVPRKLLVVDDEESICFSMSEYFSQHGFKVDTALEMEEAEGLLKQTEYKVILQDLRPRCSTSYRGGTEKSTNRHELNKVYRVSRGTPSPTSRPINLHAQDPA